MKMQLTQEVLEQTFEHLRHCGAATRECIVYLTGPVGEAVLVDGVVHPRHTAGPAGYDVDSAAIAELWRDLASEQRSIRVQVHTHPGAAFHSSRDDALAIVNSEGFFSLVIPNFALGHVGFDGAFLATRADGQWAEVAIADHLEVA